MRKTALALAAIVVAGTITYGSLGSLLRGPSVFADELIYMDATRSVATGHAPQERDRPYGRGLLFPVAAAPVFAAMPNEIDAYHALRGFNAFLFSLAAIPVYFLARRLLAWRWSIAVAALSVAAPSAVYSGLVLTESAAYLTGSCALLALLLAIERPTPRRQLVALGTCALAALARPQLAALVVAFPLGLGVRWLLLPRESRPGWTALRRLWPTAAAIGVAALLWLGALASGHVTLKDYRDVWTSYGPGSVAKWSWYTLADLTLYVAVVPAVIAPAAVLDHWRRGRDGSTRDASFIGLFLAVNALTVVLVAAFSSATFGGDRLHDRYLFYVVPLWLVLFAAWLDHGARASTRMLAIGTGLGVALLATLPPRLVVHDTTIQFDAVATAVWARIRAIDPARPGVLRVLLVLAVFAALGAVIAARRVSPRARFALLAPVVAVFAINAALVWDARVKDADLKVFADNRPSTWSWVDRVVPAGRRVADVFVESGRCLPLNTGAFRWTEFFNERIGPVFRLGVPVALVTDGKNARIANDGVVRTLDGRAVTPDYVVAPPGLALRGQELARGALAGLRLWKVDRPLRVLNATSNARATEVACSQGSA
ncbi:MAG: hypothetical protein E6G64_13730 [Actinobacteria bacterium]|nr:MAG: hypothetical protein E6G64_13730 [Actinomycetota bacterium]